MSKLTPAIIKDQQFLPEHFNAVADFDAWLQGVIDTQEALLQVRIGPDRYASIVAAVSAQVQAAALSMVCADLVERRILRVSGNVNEDTATVINSLMKVRKDYLEAADSAIGRLMAAGASTDTSGYAGATIVTGGASLLSEWPQ